MGFSAVQTYLSDVLHVVSQALLAPDIILLLVFIGYAVFSIGSVLVERFTERKHFTVVMPKFLSSLVGASESTVAQVIAESGLLKRQKDALLTVYSHRDLPGDALVALVKRLVSEEETRYDRIVGRNNTAAKVAPMLGLMGTLIPLGPGIQALGHADTAALSSSLLVAFDTTVAGLVTAAICLVIGKIRSNWYNNYLSALDAAMATMLEKIELGRSSEPQQGQASPAPTPKPASAPAPAPTVEPASAATPVAAPASGLISEPAPAQPQPSNSYSVPNEVAQQQAPTPASDANSQMSGYSFLFDRPEDSSSGAFLSQGGPVNFEPNSDPISSDGTSPRQ